MAKPRRRRLDDDRKQIRDINRVFQETHRHGLRALEQHDLKAFGEAIDVERSLIAEQRVVVDRQRAAIRRQRDRIEGHASKTKARKAKSK